ncbi:hypothetical protein ElyMa_003594000 [Elysia marginata]|uniref:RNase H type-1 domain-containing protein n=1 Tax=Elysia marginata TaxID=1093978 RepID=A0AAV4EQH5_9GAST|nr:hypothetical protein ElyMa_003594000 [Elysia marginata]
MRSTSTAACEILANVEPLEMRREKAALELFGRSKTMNTEHPNRKQVENWKPNTLLHQRPVMHYVADTKEKHFLPENRQESPRISNVVVFTDSMSVLQAAENKENQNLTPLLRSSHYLISSFGINLTMQWNPGHSNTPGKDKADTLAKRDLDRNNPTHQ